MLKKAILSEKVP